MRKLMLVATSALLIAGAGLVGNIGAGAATRTTLKCTDQYQSGKPNSLYAVVFGKVALPTKLAMGANKIQPTKPNSWYLTKQGLFVKAGATFELIVPPAWTSRMTISWGNPGTETTHLWVTGCRAATRGAKWIGFAGGYTVKQPACVPLIVKSGTQQRTVHIGAGKACPGQASPR